MGARRVPCNQLTRCNQASLAALARTASAAGKRLRRRTRLVARRRNRWPARPSSTPGHSGRAARSALDRGPQGRCYPARRLSLEVADADAVVAQAVAAGAEVRQPLRHVSACCSKTWEKRLGRADGGGEVIVWSFGPSAVRGRFGRAVCRRSERRPPSVRRCRRRGEGCLLPVSRPGRWSSCGQDQQSGSP